MYNVKMAYVHNVNPLEFLLQSRLLNKLRNHQLIILSIGVAT